MKRLTFLAFGTYLLAACQTAPAPAPPATFDPSAARLALDSIGGSVEGGAPNIAWREGGAAITFSARDQGRVRVDASTCARSPAAPLPAQADAPRMVRSMFPMVGYDRREMISPDQSRYASLAGDNIAVRRVGEAAPRALSRNGEPYMQWFLANDIWEISNNVWAPDGSARFAARTHDMRDSRGITYLDYLSSDAEEAREFRYWSRAGGALPIQTIHVVDAESGTIRALEPTGDANSYVFFLEWSPDAREIAVMRYSRDARRQEIFAADARTGRARLLYARTVEEGWVKWPGGRRTFQWLPDASGFLLQSDEDGYFQIYHHDRDGRRIAQITNARVDVQSIAGIDAASGYVYFIAAADPRHPYDAIPHRVRLSDGAPERLSEARGQSALSLAPDGRHVVLTHSDIDSPPRTTLHDAGGEQICVLEEARLQRGWRERYTPPEEVIVAGATPGVELHGLIHRPIDFDPRKRYPVIQRVYDGMQSGATRRGYFGAGLGATSEYEAMLGYFLLNGFVVVTLDAPGSPGRGRDFNLHTWGNWPGDVMDHHAAALRNLGAERPWMDLTRVGVDGNSWGGVSVLTALYDHPDLYRAGAASVPETGGLDRAAWIEWQLGSPQEAPDVYASSRLWTRADALQGPLLIVAGTSDVNVPISNTMRLLDALAEANKPYELVLFPGTNHDHRGRSDRYAYAVERITRFFQEELSPNHARTHRRAP